jgi:hypothetical protein
MNKDMVCPDCHTDIPVIDEEIKGRNIVTTGWCPTDGHVQVVE